MKMTKGIISSAALVMVLATTGASAASWQDKLSSAANQLSQNNTATTTQTGSGLSLSSLTGLLNGGDKSLSASSMNNATGVLQYCAKQKLVAATSADTIKEKLMDKLGLGSTQQQTQTEPQDYQQGLAGLLNTGNGQQLNLNNLGSSQLAQKVKTKACDLVLKQGMKFIS